MEVLSVKGPAWIYSPSDSLWLHNQYGKRFLGFTKSYEEPISTVT